MEDDSQVRFLPRVRLKILCSRLEALLVRPLPGGAARSFHGQKAVLGPASTGLQAFWPTPRGFHDPALQPASRLMYLSFYQHRVSAVGCTEQVIVKRLRREKKYFFFVSQILFQHFGKCSDFPGFFLRVGKGNTLRRSCLW